MARDWVLVEWAKLANSGNLRDVQITFQCGGLVLCGTLIGGQDYFEGVGRLALESMRGAEQPVAMTDAFASLYASHASHYDPDEREHDDPEYIHFRDVQVVFGNQGDDASSLLDVPYWRVPIAAVQGVLLGGAIRPLPRSRTAAGGDEDPLADRDD